MNYTYNLSEEYVNNLYHTIDIQQPRQLDIEEIAARIGLTVEYHPIGAMNAGDLIVLDSRVTPEEQWEDFGHELCHALWHSGGQISLPMPLRVYQEAKANNFAQYACIPSFMLRRMALPFRERDAVWLLQETFGVTAEFAQKRLRQYMQNLIYR